MSMKPGASTSPETSTTRSASRLAASPPTAAILPPASATSARDRGAPVPSITSQPRNSTVGAVSVPLLRIALTLSPRRCLEERADDVDDVSVLDDRDQLPSVEGCARMRDAARDDLADAQHGPHRPRGLPLAA